MKAFTGRSWVFDEITCWLHQKDQRFFLLTGEPGAGKSAISDRLSQFSSSTEPLHPNLLPAFLSATHHCSARDSTTVDPKNFAQAIALQLAHIPEYAIALANIDTKQNHIQVTQTIGSLTNSKAQGVVINNLDVSGIMSAQEAFNLLVLNPLQAIYSNSFNQPITILVDALDEALTHEGKRTIVDLLSKLAFLPPQVRFILTSRKVAQVENKFADAEILDLSAPAFHALNQSDIQAYIQTRFTQEETLSAVISSLDSTQQTTAMTQIAEKAEGNFLYVRFLLDAIERGERSLTDLEGLPNGLEALYYQSLERVVNLEQWRETAAVFMGILSVARTSLTLRQLQAFTQRSESDTHHCLLELRQFLEETAPHGEQTEEELQYRLYHQSVVDFLRKRSFRQGEHTSLNPYYLPAQESHQCIATHYWQPSQPLEALAWHHLDSYAYHHLAVHLLEGDRKDNFCALLTDSPRWMEAKFIHCNGDASYAADLDLAINCFSDPLIASSLLALIKLHTARQVVGQRVNRYDDIDLRTLVWLGREAEALNYARLRTNAQKRFWGLFILHKLFSQSDQPYPDLLHELQEAAYAIESLQERVSALGAVAYALVQAERKAEAEAIFAEAQQFIHQIEHQSQQTWALKELVVPFAHAGYFSEAEAVARTLENPKWQAWSLASLGASLAQANQLVKAQALFAESQAQALSLSNDHEQAWLLKAIAGALIEASNLDAAEVVAQLIRDPQKRAEALIELGTAFAKAALETQATALFTTAETLARSLKRDFQQGAALQALVKALAQAKHYAEAERIALTIEVDWTRTGALAELAAAFAQDERSTEAERIAEMIQDHGGRTFVLRVLALVHARTGKSTAATKFLQEASAIAPVIEDGEIPVFAMTILAITLKKAGRETQAEQVFQEALAAAKTMSEALDQASAMRKVVEDLAQRQFFLEAETFAQAIEISLERAWALQAIAIAYAQNDCQTEALRIFIEIEALAESVKDNQHERFALRHKAWVLEELAKALSQVGYFTEAERVAWAIEERWKQSSSLAELAKALAQARQFSEAERIARAITDTNWQRVEALCAIAVASTHAGDEATAASLLIEARQLAESIEDRAWKPCALQAVAIAFIQTGQFAKSEAIAHVIEDQEKQAWILQALAIASGESEHFTKARKAIEESVSGFQQGGMLQELAKTMARLGQSTNANELFTAAEHAVQTEAPKHQAYLLKNLATSNAQLRRFSESRRIIRDIDDWTERDQALKVLARELTQAGQFADAKELIHTIEDLNEQRWSLGSLAIALMRQQHFAEALKELEPQTPDDFVHILASCGSILDQIEAGLSLASLNHIVRILGWVRSDWRKISNILIS